MNFYKIFESAGMLQRKRSLTILNAPFRFLKTNRVGDTYLSPPNFSKTGEVRMSEVSNPMYYAELSKFNKTLPSIVSELTNSKIFKEVFTVTEPYRELLQYNMSRGRRLRAMMLIHTYRELTSNYSELDDYNIHKAYILAWCVEIANSWAIVYDDAIDDSMYRRGALSWYYKKNKNISIIFDAEFLRESMNILLDKYFSRDEDYLVYSKMLRETVVRMEMGLTEESQYENVRTTESTTSAKLELSKYTFDAYHRIVFNKTGNITYNLPLSLAMLMAGKLDKSNEALVNDMTIQLGNLWQAQNDYLDVYGDPRRTGKMGTDIQYGVCTWLILRAVELCNERQKEILLVNYGQPDPEKVKRVRELFDQLGMKNKYREYVTESRRSIIDRIEQSPDINLQNVLKRTLEATFRDEE